MKRIFLPFLLSLFVVTGFAQTFTNPLLPSGADPWSIYKDGYYYYTHTTGRNLTLWRTRSLADLKGAEKKVVWTPPATGPYSKNIWAPELHFIEGKKGGGSWYLLFAADDGRNRNHRLWVLENSSADPLAGTWTLKGQVKTPDDKWAIDGSLFEHRGKLYMVWSGWEGDENGQQDIYLCRLKNPWTATGKRLRISSPSYAWEVDGRIAKPGPDDKSVVLVNEGPQPLKRGNRVFVVYSASGCWTDSYALGMLYANGRKNLMKARNWKKMEQPVFKANHVPGTHAAGHNSFFKSPDGDSVPRQSRSGAGVRRESVAEGAEIYVDGRRLAPVWGSRRNGGAFGASGG
jgi:GH43 family beta-xylosidase